MSQGVVEVHNGELCFELLGNRSADVSVEVSSSKATKDNATFQAISPHAPSRPSTSQAIHAVEWLSRKARRAVVALPDDPELTQVKRTCEQISREEHTFLSELNDFLNEEESHENSKKSMLYKKWSERVFKPIQKEITRKMGSEAYQMLDHEKRDLFEKYLNYSTQQEVFLDTISQERYQPDKLKQLKVSTLRLNDPLTAQNDEAHFENKVIQSCEQGIPLKQTVSAPGSLCAERGHEALQWLAMELVYIDSANAQMRRKCISVERNKCSESRKEDVLRIPQKRKGMTTNQQSLSLHWKEAK